MTTDTAAAIVAGTLPLPSSGWGASAGHHGGGRHGRPAKDSHKRKAAGAALLLSQHPSARAAASVLRGRLFQSINRCPPHPIRLPSLPAELDVALPAPTEAPTIDPAEPVRAACRPRTPRQGCGRRPMLLVSA